MSASQWALLAAATLAGMTVQAAIGFGFALVVAPVLLAVLGPAEAVTCLLALGLTINLAMLYAERRPHEADRRSVRLIVAGALPGLAIGTVILANVPKGTLQVIVGAIVIAAGLTMNMTRVRPAGPPGRPGGLACGAVSGVMTTATGLNGPPLVVWISRHIDSPQVTRDTVTGSLLALNVLGVLCLTATGNADYTTDVVAAFAVLLPLVAIGHQAGRRLFSRLAAADYAGVLTAAVVIAGAASVAAGLA